MTPKDQDTFLEIVIGFAELKGKQLSAPALELYWRSMQHWSMDDFRKAAEHLLRTCTFMPTPKDFEDLRQAGRPTAGEAWDKALSFCNGGWRRGGGCGDSAVDAVVQMLGGYETIALCPLDKIGFLERRFCEHYESSQDANDTRQSVPELTSDDRANLRLVTDSLRRLA